MSGVAGNPSVNGGEDVKSSAERARQTPLHAVHERLGATMTSFAGWQMPLRYASETAEHLAVRRAAGLFDLSHMGEIAVAGPGAGAALDYALVGNLSALRPGPNNPTNIARNAISAGAYPIRFFMVNLTKSPCTNVSDETEISHSAT